MDKIFSYSRAAKDREASIFRALNPAQHAELVRAICCNTLSGYIVDLGTSVKVARHAADEIARHVIRRGWSLGI